MKKTKDGTVLSVKDLQINGKNLMELGFSGEKIGFILKDVLNQITAQQLANEEQTIISYVEKKHK